MVLSFAIRRFGLKDCARNAVKKREFRISNNEYRILKYNVKDKKSYDISKKLVLGEVEREKNKSKRR